MAEFNPERKTALSQMTERMVDMINGTDATPPERKVELLELAVEVHNFGLDTDAVVASPPADPEAPTPAEAQALSEMLDELNGRLSLITSAAMNTTTAPQEKIATILQILETTP